jgi:pimeloyl-ACP methyl ester carboxylesterase
VLSHVREGSGPPLLLTHGIGLSYQSMDGVTERLARDFEVYAVDLPGFGDSPRLDGPPTMRALTQACAEFMAAQGHERFHVAGNSLGGGVALHLALEDRVLSACGLSPIGFADGWDRAYLHLTLRYTGAAGAIAAGLMRSAAGDIGVIRRALVRQYVEHGHRQPADVYVDTFARLNAAGGYFPTARHAINWRCPQEATLPCPVTIAWGEHDRLLLTAPQSARARAWLPSARHVTLAGCGHLPAWDDPALVAETIARAAQPG